MTKHILYGDILKKTSTKESSIEHENKYTGVRTTENEELSEIATSLYPQLIKENDNEDNSNFIIDGRRKLTIR